MSTTVKPIPEGYHTVTPYIVVDDAAKLSNFIVQAFGATELFRMPTSDGKVSHAELQVGDSRIMIGGAMPGSKPMPSMIYLYVKDCDSVFKQAVNAGATVINEPADQFYGDRNGAVSDFAGNQWFIGTHIEDVAPDEMARRAAAKFGQGAHA